MGWALAALLVLSVGMPEAQAQGAPAVSVPGEFGRVDGDQQAVMRGGFEVAPYVGSYDARGHFVTLGDTRAADLVLRLGGGLRVGVEALQVHAEAALPLAYRALAGEQVAPWVGPIEGLVGVRWTLLDDLRLGLDSALRASWVPTVELYARLGVPVWRGQRGVAVGGGAALLEAGAWEPGGGARLAKYISYRDVVSWSLEGAFALARSTEGGAGVRGGASLRSVVTWTRVHSMTLSYGALGEVALRGAVYQDEQTQAATGPALAVRVGGFVSYALAYPYWEISAQLSSDWVGPRGAYNLPYVGPRVGVSLQRAFF
ncbi:hypothetical protein DL240_17920 [Lujinxingia litoralis]|uniref:Transporter n=2 Tax=Lujinxingia litoralis TaxID=2211119 RepID=A0A328C389_9DELT|nr:hypothetical protein DL240_17920 [Lujinxingia litoralis]